MKKLIVFDLDGTLAPSKSPVDGEVAALLYDLLGILRVAVISGGAWPQFEKQLLSNLSHDGRLGNLSLLPTCGTKFFTYTKDWNEIYSEDFKAEEKKRIIGSLHQAIEQAGFPVKRTWGEQIEDRGSQITYSALGQLAPLQEKEKWDLDFAKRKQIKSILDMLIPDYSVRLGGSTSIDITKAGIDKAYGIRKLEEILNILPAEMIYIGDALFPGGNDYPAKQAGVQCIAVKGPDDTKRVIETILACLGNQAPQSAIQPKTSVAATS